MCGRTGGQTGYHRSPVGLLSIEQLVISVVSDRCLKKANYLAIGCGWRAMWKVDGQYTQEDGLEKDARQAVDRGRWAVG